MNTAEATLVHEADQQLAEARDSVISKAGGSRTCAIAHNACFFLNTQSLAEHKVQLKYLSDAESELILKMALLGSTQLAVALARDVE